MGQHKNGTYITKIGRYKYIAGILAQALLQIVIGFILYNTFSNDIDARPPHQKIETQFSMTLPATARDINYWRQKPDWYEVLVRFTVDMAELEQTLNSVEHEINRCISRAKIDGYMPDFYVSNTLEWWNPQEAEIFEGVSCLNENEDYYGGNKHIMVDLTNPNEAVVYIEQFATRCGERIDFD
jgi:hypothetical protein